MQVEIFKWVTGVRVWEWGQGADRRWGKESMIAAFDPIYEKLMFIYVLKFNCFTLLCSSFPKSASSEKSSVPGTQCSVLCGLFSYSIGGSLLCSCVYGGRKERKNRATCPQGKTLLTVLLVNPPLCPDHGDRGRKEAHKTLLLLNGHDTLWAGRSLFCGEETPGDPLNLSDL